MQSNRALTHLMYQLQTWCVVLLGATAFEPVGKCGKFSRRSGDSEDGVPVFQGGQVPFSSFCAKRGGGAKSMRLNPVASAPVYVDKFSIRMIF
jgi:hypothetical protein